MTAEEKIEQLLASYATNITDSSGDAWQQEERISDTVKAIKRYVLALIKEETVKAEINAIKGSLYTLEQLKKGTYNDSENPLQLCIEDTKHGIVQLQAELKEGK